MTEGTVQVGDDIVLFYRAIGSGREIVFVPNGSYLEGLLSRVASQRTLVFYDVRNRGRSSAVSDDARLVRGIHNDVDDLDAVRRHFEQDRVDLIGHSYVGTMLMLYALKHPDAVRRIVAIGPMGPQPARRYEPPLSYADGTTESVMDRLRALEPERGRRTPEDFCRMAWTILAELYVTHPADASKALWGRCELPNERAAMTYWMRHLLPSLNGLALDRPELQAVTAPALIIHGRKDRSAPYGGGRDWAEYLPNARLVTVDEAGHAPWIEAPERVHTELNAFLA